MGKIKEKIKDNSNLIMTICFLFLIFLMIDHIIGKSIFESSPYNSYELQAMSWLKGKTFLEHDYSYLELAIYKGHYFVSFPPLPSVLILPFIIIFGQNVPTNLLMFIFLASELVIIYKILKRYKTKEINALLLALGFTVGTNLMTMAIDSGVWFFAQVLNNLLCIIAIDAFLKKKKTMAYFFLALAVGCRPFSIIYMFMFFLYYLINEKEEKFSKRIINNFIPVIPGIIIGICYMTYNLIRFDSILEFGHNYLPEFTNSEYGQFSLNYLLPNLKELFFNKVIIDGKLNFNFNTPFSLLIANPVIIVYLYKMMKNIIQNKKIDQTRLLFFVFIIINILGICLHRTLGGWQFGARYSCDILPIMFLSIIWYKDKKGNIKEVTLNKFEICLIIFGIILNVFGAIIYYSNKLF